MAYRVIVTDPDPVLRKKARPVERFDERLRDLAEDMIETMREGNGIGLAANQIGILKRIFVMDLGDEEGTTVVINPQIEACEGEQIELEGCLSIPHIYGHVRRPMKLKLRYQNLQGEDQEMEAEGLRAACICHETDHLNGVLFTDQVEGELYRLVDKDGEEKFELIPRGEVRA